MSTDTPTSAAEWDQFEARDIGSERPEQPWILSDRDVWYRNPHYVGPDTPHPEQDHHDELTQRLCNDGLTDQEIQHETSMAMDMARVYDQTDEPF